MMLDELIERLCELKRAYGEQEVKLLTQKDAWKSEHGIDEVTYDGDKIVIVGKEKTRTES